MCNETSKSLLIFLLLTPHYFSSSHSFFRPTFSLYILLNPFSFEISNPFTSIKYEIGKTFKIIQHPQRHYNRPFKLKRWFINIDIPEGLGYLLYHSNTNTWDFLEEFVIDDESSSCCTKYKTIKAIKRVILKWELPVGTIVTCTGRYVDDTYKFEII